MKDSFYIFGLEIKFYGIIVTGAMVCALILFMVLCHMKTTKSEYTNEHITSKAIDGEFCLSMFLFAIIFALIGARLVYCLPREEFWGSTEAFLRIFNLRTGGLTIIGGIPAGAIGIAICCKIYKKSVFRVLDFVVPALLLGQVLGRWGNFFNQELYGLEITNAAWQFFPFAVNINGTFHIASFFLEMMLNLIGLVIALALIFTVGKKMKTGVMCMGYLVWYGMVRGLLEFVKNDPLKWGDIRVVQMICFIMVPIGIVGIVLIQRGVIKLETVKMYNKHYSVPLEPPVYEA